MSAQSVRAFQFIVGFVAVFGLVATQTQRSVVAGQLMPKESRPQAPEFRKETSAGGVADLAGLRGKVVLLNFWATWCGPCKAEIPWFIEFAKRYQSAGFEVLGVSMDDDGWDSVRPFIAARNISFPIVLGDDRLASRYGGVESLPETILIDRSGKIAFKHVGLVSRQDLEQQISRLLQEK